MMKKCPNCKTSLTKNFNSPEFQKVFREAVAMLNKSCDIYTFENITVGLSCEILESLVMPGAFLQRSYPCGHPVHVNLRVIS